MKHKRGDILRVEYADPAERECTIDEALERGAVIRRAYGEYFAENCDILIICSDVCDSDDQDVSAQEFTLIVKGGIRSVRRLS